MSSFPSSGQFKLLKFGVGLAIFIPIIALTLIIKTGFYASDYISDVRDTGRLQREGTVTPVPLSGEPRHSTVSSDWHCPLLLPDGRIVEFTRTQKPEGLTHLYFYEHPDITGTISFPKYKFNSNSPDNRQMVLEVSAHPDWDETFAALAEATFVRKTTILAALIIFSACTIWLAWKSYWWMKGGRRRRRRRHHHSS